MENSWICAYISNLHWSRAIRQITYFLGMSVSLSISQSCIFAGHTPFAKFKRKVGKSINLLIIYFFKKSNWISNNFWPAFVPKIRNFLDLFQTEMQADTSDGIFKVVTPPLSLKKKQAAKSVLFLVYFDSTNWKSLGSGGNSCALSRKLAFQVVPCIYIFLKMEWLPYL